MSSAQVILLLTFVLNSVVGGIVFITNPKRTQNQLFLLFSFSLTAWTLFVLSILQSNSATTADLGVRGASIAGAFIPVTFYLFCQSIAKPDLSLLLLCRKTKTILILSFLVSIMCGTPFFLKEVQMPSAENDLMVPEASYGPGFIIFILFFPIVIYRTVYVFYKVLRASAGVAKIEMQFALTGMTIAVPFAFLIHLIAIVSGSSYPQQYGPLCIIPMNLVIAYGIATRRILGIETVLRRAVAYILLFSFLSLVYFAVYSLIVLALRDMLPTPTSIAHVMATVTALLFLSPAQGQMQIAASKLFDTKSGNITSAIKRANESMQAVTTVSALIEQLAETLKDALRPTKLILLERVEDHYVQQYPQNSADLFSLTESDPLVSMIRDDKTVISLDSLLRIRGTEDVRLVLGEMSAHNFSIAMGIFQKNELRNILILGPRSSGAIYDKNEQDALQILCGQFAVALENARLYTEMQDSKIRTEIMLDQMVSGVIVADPERRISLINHEAQRIIGLNEDDTIGRDIRLLPKPITEILEATLSCQTGLPHSDAALPTKDEERPLYLRMGTAYLLGHDKKPMGALLVFTDMTAIRSLEEQVRRADQLSSVGTLAAGMAHEIKNPLVTIKTFTHLLPERYEDADFRRDFSSLVAHEVARIDGIVNHLLNFSKPTKPNLVPMRLHSTVQKTLELIQEQLSQRSIELCIRLEAEHDLISGDSDLLTQTLVNLNLNAMEAIGSSGRIEVSSANCIYRFALNDDPAAAVTRAGIRLQISDTGRGIAPDQIQKIFDPFYTSKSEGTGMGLSVSHGIIREHHGRIEVDSTLGKGTTFSVYLPLFEEHAA